MAIPTLKTERLVLRAFNFSDASRIQSLAGDFEIADTTLNIPYPYEDGIAEDWIRTHSENFENGKSLILAICLSESNSVIGSVSLMNINAVHQNAELGYWIGKAFWNKGYCTEACLKVLEFGFNDLNLHRIYAHHMTRNPASGKVLTKAGMKYEGRIRQSIVKWDKFEDIDIYGILRSEFKKVYRLSGSNR